eukprot:g2612.t1
MPVEIRQTASRPRSRSEIFCSGLPRAQSTKESIETYPGRGGESRSSRRSNASNSIASNSSETAQNDRCGGGGTTSEQDALKDLQERYNIDAVPTVQQYRVAGKAAGYRITADLMKPRNERPYVSFGVKLKNDAAVVKKVVVTPQFTDFRFFTRALEFGVLQLQLSLGFDWNKKIFGASWRCKTKWTKGSKIQKKFEVQHSLE